MGRCNFLKDEKKCKKRTVLVVGFCNYCKKDYCNLHRLPESHYCIEFNKLKPQRCDEQTKKLMREKCVAKKVTNI
jgi:predicted nucleic acid binding AN1-type Zn finger protein